MDPTVITLLAALGAFLDTLEAPGVGDERADRGA